AAAADHEQWGAGSDPGERVQQPVVPLLPLERARGEQERPVAQAVPRAEGEARPRVRPKQLDVHSLMDHATRRSSDERRARQDLALARVGSEDREAYPP